MTKRLGIALMVLGMSLPVHTLADAEAPRVLELRTQMVDEINFFHLRVALPNDFRLPTFDIGKPFGEGDRRKFARLPRLVPLDGKTRAVYYRYKPGQTDLQFYGQVTAGGKARFRLFYPVGETPGKEPLPLAELLRSPGMAETIIEVDLATAKPVTVPKLDAQDLHLSRDDLRSYWALYQASHFAVLETQVIDFAFYSFAREATSRKYAILAPAWVKREEGDPQHRLYEVTTGADAIAETLQVHRLLHPENRDRGGRTVEVSRVQGVQAPEAPWQRLLAGKRPELEPIARLIPSDNYYIHFKDLGKFIECGELLDHWGTSVLRLYEMKSRDCRLWERYEQQLCLQSTALGKLLGPLVIKGLAVTGSDLYFREGTDLTLIFDTVKPATFLAGVEIFLKEARQKHGERLRERREDYQKVSIESFVTPLREVSLHRAVLGDHVIYSNSPAGIRRVIDAHQGRQRCLADAADFQYQRTIFPLGDKDEQGFVFLSDAFLRQLVGPVSRIKEKRRLEALTSLSMLTHAALFHGWETGKLPTDRKAALAGAALSPADVEVPEGKPIVWDPKSRMAISDAYNTIHFATPLIELPLDKITPSEEKGYAQFREEYNLLWRGYFDPIASRVALDEKRVRVETHILPVVNNSTYRALRDMTETGKVHFKTSASGVVDFRLNLPNSQGWIAFQVDESALLRTMVELLIRWESGPGTDLRKEYDRLFWKLPVGVAVGGHQDPNKLAEDILTALQGGLVNIAAEKPQVNRYKETAITRLSISAEKYRALAALVTNTDRAALPLDTILALVPKQEAPAAIHVAVIDKVIQISASEEFVKGMIDQAEARKKDGGKDQPAAALEVSSLLYLAPSKVREGAGLLLEYEGHSLALLNNQVWGCFFQAGVVTSEMPDREKETAVRNFLGYLPVSPDGSVVLYDPNAAEVVNRRHGSFRQPRLHTEPAEMAPVWLLNQVRSIRAELRFHNDGMHAVVSIHRK